MQLGDCSWRPKRLAATWSILAGATLGLSSTISAAEIAWSGVETTWVNNNSWVGAIAPSNDLTTDVARFDLFLYNKTPVLYAHASIAGVKVGSQSGEYNDLTIGARAGYSLSIGASGITIAPGPGGPATGGVEFTTALGVVAAVDQTWTNNDSYPLKMNGPRTYTGHVTLAGSGPVSLGGTSTGLGGVTINGPAVTTSAPTAFGDAAAPLTLTAGALIFSKTTTIPQPITVDGDFVFGMTGNYAGTLSAPVVISGDQSLTFNPGTGSSATIKFTNTVTLNGDLGINIPTDTTYGKPQFLAAITGAGGIHKLGIGPLTLGAGSSDAIANTFTGTSTLSQGTVHLAKQDGTDAISGDILLSGTTLILDRSNQIKDTATLTFAGGLFNINGKTESLGDFALADDTTLQFGTTSNSQSNTLNFTGLGTITGGVLSLTNWNGKSLGGGTDRFFIGTSPMLSPNQLTSLHFVDPTVDGAILIGDYYASQLASGELVPGGAVIPEPASLSLVLVSALALRRRRVAPASY